MIGVSEQVTGDEMIRRTTQINYEIVITHGAEGGVGFLWNETFIHDPFADPQYGAFPVNPAEQYGDAYRQSIFAVDPAQALEMARRQLRDKASEDLKRYCIGNHLEASATIESICGVRVAEADHLTSLTDEQVTRLWAHVDGIPENMGREIRRGA
jgi:hypothetical protein